MKKIILGLVLLIAAVILVFAFSSDARKLLVKKGPGGCRGEECAAYCRDPKNQVECFKFAEDNGLLTDEVREKMRVAVEKINKLLDVAPPAVVECVKSRLGEENYEKVRQGEYAGPISSELFLECSRM